MRTQADLSARLAAAERELRALKAEVARNDAKMHRMQQRELCLLHAEDLQTLIRELTDGLQSSFRLQQVTVVLCDPDHDIRHLLLAAGTPAESIKDLQLVESLIGLAPNYTGLRRTWLGPFAACDHQLLFPNSKDLASVALIPLTRNQDLIGSINLGSTDDRRFTRQHGTDFLARLGIIASACVDNTVNRARLLRSGFTDVLTGWHNRRYLQSRLHEELARARRERQNIVCLMLDVDHFKAVNDTYGHSSGDAVLKELANRIDAEVRKSDVAARYGGEEFVVLMPNTDLRSGALLAERIRRTVSAEPFLLPSGERRDISASIGLAGIAPGADQGDLKTAADSLIARADVALYRAKAAGRNRIRVDTHE